MNEEPDYPPQSPLTTGILGRCPRCGKGRMFNGFINLAPRCDSCGLDYAFADSGDGPAVFVCLLAGFVVLGIALWAELSFEPPIWLQLVVFLPLTLIVCLGMLRPLKGLLIAQQFRTKAEATQRPRM